MAGDDPGQQQPADRAVRAELGEAVGRAVDVNPRRLPGELNCRRGEPGPEPAAEPNRQTRQAPQQHRRGIENEQPRPGARAQRQGRGFDPDQRVVLLVLMRVDRVVADSPEHPAEIEQQRRPAERAGDRGPADQRPPIEIEAEKELRPIGHPLHQRISADQSENGDPEHYADPVQAEQHGGADCQLRQHRKTIARAHADRTARQRPQPGAGDLAVIMAIGDVVEGAARAPHATAPSANSAISAGSGQRGRPAQSPTSRETAAARSRSGGRGGRGARRAGQRRQPAPDPVAANDVARSSGAAPPTRLATAPSPHAGEGGPGRSAGG